MKKFKSVMLVAMVLSMGLIVTSCMSSPLTWLSGVSDEQSRSDESGDYSKSDGENSDLEIPDTYKVPEGWVKAEEYSTDDKYFYCRSGEESNQQPDNIAISVGENDYKAQDHMKFKDAILSQLMDQLDGSGAEINGDGTYTDQDYVLYIFTVTETNGMVTKFYYIVDDYRFCMVQSTNVDGAEDVDKAAEEMVNSFTWS